MQRSEDGSWLSLFQGAAVHHGPAVAPVYAHEPHLSAFFRRLTFVAVQRHPCRALVIDDYLCVVSRSGNEVVAVEHFAESAVAGAYAFLGIVGAEHVFGA